MRLLHSSLLMFQEFHDPDIPPYAILSHTWIKNEEVNFQEMCAVIKANESPYPRGIKLPEITVRSGFDKIVSCCARARKDMLQYVWIDTCCVDKTSSAELSEAINSMYRWYFDSTICYAFLNDLPASKELISSSWMAKFRQSRWFTRGWTLQELLAPRRVIFFSCDWSFIGTRSHEVVGSYFNASLIDAVMAATGIDSSVLVNRDLSPYSVAQKMFWASRRLTTRIEDRVYCLLGLFDMNMPLLYGEGHRAFKRLQEEIIRSTDDHTIFAWENDVKLSVPFDSFLAPSPAAFNAASSIVQSTTSTSHRPYTITNKGLQIELDLCRGWGVLAILDCTYAGQNGGRLAVWLDAPGSRAGDGFDFTLSRQSLNRKEGNELSGIVRDNRKTSPIFLNFWSPEMQALYRRVLYLTTYSKRTLASDTARDAARTPNSFTLERGFLGSHGFSVSEVWPQQAWNNQQAILYGHSAGDERRLAILLERAIPSHAAFVFLTCDSESGMVCNLYFLKGLLYKHVVTQFGKLPFLQDGFWRWMKPLRPDYTESLTDGLLDGSLMIKGTMKRSEALHEGRIFLDISFSEYGQAHTKAPHTR